jgi:intracellular sulfur oxidation DsrE/DsrF family protein
MMTAVLLLTLDMNVAIAAGNSTDVCTVGAVSGLTLDEEFGAGAQALTRCLKKRRDVKVVMQVNQHCDTMTNGVCTRAYGLHNIGNMLDDYEITHGLKAGRDYEVAAVVHSGGGKLMLKGNPFEPQVQALMARGVKFYFCQNTVRSYIKSGALPLGAALANITDGVLYVTSGVTAVADFQGQGYRYVQP